MGLNEPGASSTLALFHHTRIDHHLHTHRTLEQAKMSHVWNRTPLDVVLISCRSSASLVKASAVALRKATVRVASPVLSVCRVRFLRFLPARSVRSHSMCASCRSLRISSMLHGSRECVWNSRIRRVQNEERGRELRRTGYHPARVHGVGDPLRKNYVFGFRSLPAIASERAFSCNPVMRASFPAALTPLTFLPTGIVSEACEETAAGDPAILQAAKACT